MLVKYKNDYKKIAMGLLSFIPDLKEVSRLETEIEWYQKDENRILYLWKNENLDFTGIVGVEVSQDIVMVRQIALTPSERDRNVCYQILDALDSNYPDHKMMGSLEVAPMITKWEQRNEAKRK
ncbi:MAG TPA: N-acetyltransferase [Candidatus Ligilactobacillus excrementigallinarum]|uniref:N-acetyltransferase n=1 Tax=Candidatus Ligilactobacillus excrementigallinarum TaxID=2838641 RepID=A0A9D1UVF2_9LACO|nr:N-acetyltransferase [Candidatus Ligilactobacillus excrementigallinarum]